MTIADALLDTSDAGFDLRRAQRVVELDAQRRDDLVGSELDREDAVRTVDPGLAPGDGLDRVGDFGISLLADQQALAFARQQSGGRGEDEAQARRLASPPSTRSNSDLLRIALPAPRMPRRDSDLPDALRQTPSRPCGPRRGPGRR